MRVASSFVRRNFLWGRKNVPLGPFCFVIAQGTIILGGVETCPRKSLQNYTQIYAILVLSRIALEVIFV